jgi:uncharacterized protein
MKDDTTGMEIDLGRVEDREAFSFQRNFSIPTTEGGTAECRASVTGEVVKLGERFEVTARVTGEIFLECHRCLARFPMPVDVSFSLVLQRGERVEPPAGVEIEDFIVLPAGEGAFDLFPRVRETMILEIPIKVLCKEDCKGLCPKCGANLNEETCGCLEKLPDDRWGPLRKSLNEDGKR